MKDIIRGPATSRCEGAPVSPHAPRLQLHLMIQSTLVSLRKLGAALGATICLLWHLF